jgi:AraC family transcriptional regulator
MTPDPTSIDTLLLRGEAGAFDVPPPICHLLTVHAAGKITQEISCDGRRARRGLSPGDLDLLPAGAPARIDDEGASKVLVVAIPTAIVQRHVEEIGLRPTSFQPMFGLRDPQLAGFAWSLHRRQGRVRRDLYDDCLAAEIVRRILCRQDPRSDAATSAPQPLSGPRLGRVIDYIEAHLDEPITIQDLALEAGLGSTAFKAAFRNTFAAPAHRYLVRRRAERARLLLLAGDLPASQVALEAGFSHQTHMARWLRRLFGVLPSELARRTGQPNAPLPPMGKTLLDQGH